MFSWPFDRSPFPRERIRQKLVCLFEVHHLVCKVAGRECRLEGKNNSLSPWLSFAPFAGGVNVVHQSVLIDFEAREIAFRHFGDGELASCGAGKGAPWSQRRRPCSRP